MIFTDKAAKEKISTLESRIIELESDIVAKDSAIESMTADLTAKDETITEHLASIASRDETIADITGKLSAAEALATAKDSEIVTLKAEVETASASAAQRATEMLASAGQPVPLPIEEANTPVDHLAVVANLTGSERTSYYAKHGDEIRKQLTK